MVMTPLYNYADKYAKKALEVCRGDDGQYRLLIHSEDGCASITLPPAKADEVRDALMCGYHSVTEADVDRRDD